MLIRNQDKKRIINLDNITIIEITKVNNYGITCFDAHSDFHFYIGMYSTEEKALKVLDMIQKQYEIMKNCNYTTEFGVTGCKIANEISFLHTFQMPLDSEVE